MQTSLYMKCSCVVVISVSQLCLTYFLTGASDRFQLDQHRLLQHTSVAEVLFKDLVLAVQLEVQRTCKL